MNENENQKPGECKPVVRDELAGTFVETALTNEQVDQANAEEEQLGIRNDDCAFLRGDARK